MKVYIMPHGAYSIIKEKEIFSLETLIKECNNKIMGKMGFTIFGNRITDSEGRSIYDEILYNQDGTADYD